MTVVRGLAVSDIYGMAALTTVQEYAAVRQAIQLLTTLDSNSNRRDIVSFSVGELSVTYAASQLEWLQKREVELAKRITARNVRKRTTPDFTGGDDSTLIGVIS